MSEQPTTDDLVAELAAGLEPVRPVAPLRTQVLVIAGGWVATAIALALLAGARPAPALATSGVSLAMLVVLAGLGTAGVLLGLAARIPGRERVVRAAGVAVVVSAAALLALFVQIAATPPAPGLSGRIQRCIDRSFLLALPPGLLAAGFAIRAARWHAVASAIAIAVGASALGGLLVHLTCPSAEPWHWLVSHALAPAAGGVAIGLAAGWTISRWRAREDRRRAR